MTQTNEAGRAVGAARLGISSFRSRIDTRDLTEPNAELQAQNGLIPEIAAIKYHGEFARFS